MRLRDEYCPNEELQRLEEEFWNLTVQGTDIISYTTKFQQLALLCPSMVDPERKRIERYIKGLPESVQGNVISSKPETIQSAIRMAHELMAQVARREKAGNSSKRKWEGNPTTSNKKVETDKADLANPSDKKEYKGSRPYCSKCKLHHDGLCPCTKCKRFGHLTQDCKATTTGNDASTPKTCYECNGTGHFRKDCPKLKDKNGNTAKGRFYVLNTEGNPQNPRLIDVLNAGMITYK